MNKTILSVFVLAAAIITAVILYGVVVKAYPTFGGFWNLLYLGLITFGLGVMIYISGLLLEKGIKESKN